MRIGNRRGHEHIGFVAGIAEHQALVAGALLVVGGLVDADGDILRLFANAGEDGTGFPVKTHIGAVVADIFNDHAHQIFRIDPR